MSSQLQIEANRRNSHLSTGPRTPEGKAVSRFNALKSGINAKAQVIPGDDPDELEAVASGYHREWAPTTYLERFLVDSLVRADWLLQRLSRLEAQLWTLGQPPDLHTNAPLAETYDRDLDRFTRLQRRIDSTERSFYRALTELRRLQDGAGAPSLPNDPTAECVPSVVHPGTERPSNPIPARPPAESATASLGLIEMASFCRFPGRGPEAPLYPWMKVPPARKNAPPDPIEALLLRGPHRPSANQH